MQRRHLLRLLAASAAAPAALPLAACSGDEAELEAAIAADRAPLPASPALLDLVRHAALAANGHNTQPWTFAVQADGVVIRPDFTRRTPVVDPDDHHLYASLGCAAENLSIAAGASGRSGEVRSSGSEGVAVSLAAGRVRCDPLLGAIPKRQCSRSDYSGKPLAADVTGRLRAAAAVEGVETLILSDAPAVESALELIIDGNSRQMANPEFVAELKQWIRFNAIEAVRKGDGLFSASSGNPTLPSSLGPLLFDLFFSASTENDKYARQIRSSAGLAVFVAATNDPAGWIAAGRACQRFMLQATVEGLACAFVNQAVEEAEPRAQLQGLLGIGGRRPNLVLRYGSGPLMPYSVRRPPQSLIVNA